MTELASMIPIHSLNVAASVAHEVNDHSEGEGEDQAPKSGMKHMFSIAAVCLAVGSFAVQIVAILSARAIIMYVAGGLAIVTASAVGVRQFSIARMDTLRNIHNKMREEVNRMTEENNELTENVNELQQEVGRVADIEAELSKIAEAGHTSCNHLVGLVNENAITLKKQAKIVKAQMAEQILTSILRTDRDQNLNITDKEVDILFMRLRAVSGANVNETQMRSVLRRNDGSVGSLMQFLRSINEEEGNEDMGFMVDLEKLHA